MISFREEIYLAYHSLVQTSETKMSVKIVLMFIIILIHTITGAVSRHSSLQSLHFVWSSSAVWNWIVPNGLPDLDPLHTFWTECQAWAGWILYDTRWVSLTLWRPETRKWILWQTEKTQMKCRIMRHFISVCTVCLDKIDLHRNEYVNNIIWRL